MDYFVATSFVAPAHMGIQNKPGAVPVKNSQSIVSIKKVRRVPRSIFSSDEESGEDDFFEKHGRGHPESENTTVVPEPNKEIEIREGDSLLRRLMRLKQQGHNDDDDEKSRKRKIREFEVTDAEENSENWRKCIKLDSSESSDEEEELSDENIERRREIMHKRIPLLQEPECITLDSSESSDEEEELSDENIERRREIMHKRIPLLQEPECITLDSSESTDSEEEMAPRLNTFQKPKRRRITVAEKEEEAKKAKQAIIKTHELVQEYIVSLKKTIT